MSVLAWIFLILIVLAALVVLAAVFFVRATNEASLVKTGVGGRKVVIDGGTFALPYFHEISRVNMQTIRMSVTCAGEGSLITRDRLRVDAGAEFCVSVKPEAETVARAAQTLGKRLFQPEQLKDLLYGMMVDALRGESAKASMDELHESRSAFVANVQTALMEPLSKYGLQADSVSLVALDQTQFAALDENNAFNAVGMRKLAEVVANSRKERAEIEAASSVSVSKAAMEAEKRKLEITLEHRRAEIAQAQEIETLTAAQLAEVARIKAESELTRARARIQMQQAIEAEEIVREQTLREAEILRARALTMAEQDRQIQIAAKSQEESRAQAEADAARAEAVKAAESVRTAEAVAEAERRKVLALLQAQQEGEAAAARVAIAAQSEKDSAAARRAAREEEAAALKTAELAKVEAARALIEAENARSEANVALTLEQARLAALPQIVAEMVKPAEKIKGISINHVSGLGGGAGGDGQGKAPVSQAIDSILEMAVQLPALKKIGDAVGANLDGALPDLKKGENEKG